MLICHTLCLKVHLMMEIAQVGIENLLSMNCVHWFTHNYGMMKKAKCGMWLINHSWYWNQELGAIMKTHFPFSQHVFPLRHAHYIDTMGMVKVEYSMLVCCSCMLYNCSYKYCELNTYTWFMTLKSNVLHIR